MVFGPTKTAPTVLRWWPIALTGLGVVLPVVGISVPGDFAFGAAWWAVIGLAILVLLCFRALWILHAAVALDFPPAEIEIEPFIAIHSDDSDVEPEHTILFFKIRVTNREPTHRLNLVFDMSLRWPMGESFLSHKLFRERDPRFKDRLKDRIEEPLLVEPQATVEGELIYTWEWSKEGKEEDRWINFDGYPRFRAKRDGSEFLLTVHDYVSDGSITLSCPGTWSSPRSRRALETKTKTK